MKPSEWNNMTNDKRREYLREKGLMNRKTIITIAIFVVVLFIAISLSSGSTLDPEKVEAYIREDVRKQTGLAATVQCPDGIDIEPGQTFDCRVVTKSEQATFTVAIENDKGDVSWWWSGQ